MGSLFRSLKKYIYVLDVTCGHDCEACGGNLGGGDCGVISMSTNFAGGKW